MSDPTVNINGTDRDSLTALYRDAADKLGEALTALCLARPHGRDYQTMPAGSYEGARKVHEFRIADVRHAQKEMMRLAIHVANQV